MIDKATLQKVVTEALMGMIASITRTTPPPNEPPPPFIQSAIDRATSRIYTACGAPRLVAINLPRRKVKTEYSTVEEDAQVDAWNAALDAVQELNR